MSKNRSILQKEMQTFWGKISIAFSCCILLYLCDLEEEEGNCTVVHPADFIYVHVEQISFKLPESLGKHMLFREQKEVGQTLHLCRE